MIRGETAGRRYDSALRKAPAAVPGLLKATLAAGLLFLLPLIVVTVLVSHALEWTRKATRPLTTLLHLESAVGAAGETLLAVAVLLLIALLAGLVARTRAGTGMLRWSERSLLGSLPQYRLVKSIAQGVAAIEDTQGLSPALVNLEEGWQIGYLVESLDSGWVTVFVPQAPTPLSGNVMYLPAQRVRALDITMVQAMAVVKAMGAGSRDALRGADMTLPEARVFKRAGVR